MKMKKYYPLMKIMMGVKRVEVWRMDFDIRQGVAHIVRVIRRVGV